MSTHEKMTRMGDFLIRRNILTQEQVNEILAEQNKVHDFTRLRFGRIAVNKGYATEEEINKVMMEKYQAEKKNNVNKKKKNDNPYPFLLK